MLLALGAIALVGIGFLVTWLVLHRHHHHHPQVTVTVRTTTHGSTAATIAVPDVRNTQVAQARTMLRSVGLRETETTVTTPHQPAGTVVSQAPNPGSHVAKGSQVLLTIAAAATTSTTTTTPTTVTTPTTTAAPPPQPTTATVPDLSGQSEAQAAQALGKAGILISVAFVPSTDPLGTVESQARHPGTTVPYHSHVQVNVSTGPGTKPSELVPNVVGKTLTQALAAINAAHLRLLYLKFPVTTRAQAGKVVQQSPIGGNHAPQNAQVVVYLAAYRP